MNDVSVYMDGEEVQPSNPFLKQNQHENNLLDIAMQVLATITARKAPRKKFCFALIKTVDFYLFSADFSSLSYFGGFLAHF